MFRRFMTTNHFEIRLKAEALDPMAWLESANRLIASAEKLEDYFEEFWNTFGRILREAHKIGIYNPVDYSQNPEKYCGIIIRHNPYFH